MQLIQMQKPINHISHNQIRFKPVPQISRRLWTHNRVKWNKMKYLVPAKKMFSLFSFKPNYSFTVLCNLLNMSGLH